MSTSDNLAILISIMPYRANVIHSLVRMEMTANYKTITRDIIIMLYIA